MAVLYITEYQNQAVLFGSREAPIALEPPITTQTVAIGAGHAESAAFNANTQLVRLSTDAICSILFGTGPAAATTSPRMPADTIEYFAVPRGGSLKVSVIANT